MNSDNNYLPHPAKTFSKNQSELTRLKYHDRFRFMAIPVVMAVDSGDNYDGHERAWLLGKPV